MRVRPLVVSVVLFGAALGAVSCSSSAVPTPSGTTSGSTPAGVQPTGTVTVRSGNKVVCVITLGSNGTGTCKVSTKGDMPGKVTYTGTYSGGGSGSTTVTLLPSPKQSS